jgi:hypothetical protein
VVKVEVEETPFWRDQWLAEDVVAALAKHGLVPVARDNQDEDQHNELFVSERLLERQDIRERLA